MDRRFGRWRRLAAAALLAAVHIAVMLALIAVSLRDTDTSAEQRQLHAGKGEPMQKAHLKYKGGPNFGANGGVRRAVRGLSHRVHWCRPLRLVNPPKTTLAVLASFPGSGNTWLRYLLQQATGLLTGSVYKDYALMKNGFPAESFTNGSVFVVKTHEWGPRAREPYSLAVVLIRSPKESIQAEFNRQYGGHIGFAPADTYRRIWQHYVGPKLRDWKRFHMDWLGNFTKPKHIIYYEDLVNEVEKTIRDILQFLKHPVDENLLRCAIERKEGIYRRKRRPLNMNLYTASLEMATKLAEQDVFKEVYKIQRQSSAMSETNSN